MLVFQKIISIITSIIMAVFSLILPPSNNPPLPANGEVISSGSASRLNKNTPVICKNYTTFEAFCDTSNDKALDEYAQNLDKEIFDNCCIVAANIEVSSPAQKVYITCANYNGNTLEINYVTVNYPYVTVDVISYETIIVYADKSINKVKLNNEDTIDAEFYPQKYMYPFSIANAEPVSPYYPEDDGGFEGCFIFEDYESWANFRDNGNWEFSNYKDIAAIESFFEKNNLVVVITALSSGGHTVRFSDMAENNGKAVINLCDIYEPGLHTAAEHFDATLISVDKETKTAEISYTNIDLPFRLDGKIINR